MIATLESVVAQPQPAAKPNPLEALKQTVSASRLNCWLTCRLKFFFRDVEKVRKPPTSALHVGTVVHAVLQAWNMGRWRMNPSLANGACPMYAARIMVWKRRRLLTTEKIAVLAPIPSASAATATAANAGLRRMERSAYRTSDANVARPTPYNVFKILTPGGSANKLPGTALLISTESEYIWKMRSPLRILWMS